MKVVLLNDQLNAGGAERVLVNTANLLRKNDIDVHVLLLLGPAALDHLLDPKIPVTYLHRKGRFDLKAMRTLRKIVANADVLHVHSRYNLRYVMVCKMMVGIGKCKIVFQEHIPLLQLDLFTRWAFTQVSAYVAVLKTMCTWVTTQKLVSANKVFYLPNIVQKPSTVTQHQYKSGRVVMVGNFMRLKNQFFAVDLIGYLGETYSLDIYGMVHHADYFASLQQYITKKKLDHRIKLIQGVTNVFDVLGQYEFAVHTSTHETGPLVLLEYMYAGVPFISYSTGDVAAHLSTEMPELVVDNFDLDSWKSKVESGLTDASKRNGIQRRMLEFVQSRYTEEHYLDQLKQVYQSVLN